MTSSPSALSTGLALFGLQLVSRLLTFSLNQALVRLTTPQALGVATIQFEVLLNTALFLGREGFRGALVRTANRPGPKSPVRAQQTTNATFLPLCTGIVTSVVVFGLYRATVDDATRGQPNFLAALALYLLATFLELVAEPLFIGSLIAGDTRKRVRIEGAGVIAKTCTTLAVVVLKGEAWGLLAFALGQAVYGAVLAFGFWSSRALSTSQELVFPRRPQSRAPDESEAWLNPQDTSMSWALTRQSLVKQFLSEGDKVIVGRVCRVEDQGGYALALNYGSLVARVLFQPIEETARLYFSRSSAGKASSFAPLLSSLLYLYAHLSLVFVSFGPPYIPSLLSLLLGRSSRFLSTSAPQILQAYCLLLPLLGINGVLEAFVQAVADEKQLGKMGAVMTLWSGVFVGSAWLGTRTVRPAEVGMVVATGVNMACRIAWAASFVRDFSRQPSRADGATVTDFVPNKYTVAAFAVGAQAARWSVGRTSSQDVTSTLVSLGIGSVAALFCLLIVAVTDRPRLKRVLFTIRRA